VSDLCRLFASHLAGGRVGYDGIAVELGACTSFEQELARALRAVEWGEVVTYGELAALAGRPRAARAAGAFCAAGGLALVLPYHRVVAADGIGGFGTSGVSVKRRLLALEGVEL
jgi:methylated-DNA-[protein]-cysteine S-methyltransferase